MSHQVFVLSFNDLANLVVLYCYCRLHRGVQGDIDIAYVSEIGPHQAQLAAVSFPFWASSWTRGSIFFLFCPFLSYFSIDSG